MMQKLWQIKLKLKYSKDVFDIVQFGSSVIEGKEPNDLDVAIIFNKIPLKEQLNQAQKIKKQLQEKTNLSIHIKSFDLYSLFDISNFAKENILIYGKSIISKNSFSKKFGFQSVIQISYNLNHLEKKDKIRFNYMLSGKKGNYGLIRKHKAKLLKPGLIVIAPEHENIFVDAIKKFTKKFEARAVLTR